MQEYKWQENQAYLIQEEGNNLILDLNRECKIIPCIPPHQLRTLVSTSTNPENNNSSIYSLFQTKLD